jgi:hypothetical protein
VTGGVTLSHVSALLSGAFVSSVTVRSTFDSEAMGSAACFAGRLLIHFYTSSA